MDELNAVLVISMIFTLIVVIGSCCLWGYISNLVIRGRGYYYENWFWWGFFCGIAPVIAALILPDKSIKAKKNKENISKLEKAAEESLKEGYWRCICGKANPPYTGTCACGKNKY